MLQSTGSQRVRHDLASDNKVHSLQKLSMLHHASFFHNYLRASLLTGTGRRILTESAAHCHHQNLTSALIINLTFKQYQIPKKKKCKKAKWLSEEALQIAVKRREVKSKGEKERYTHSMQSSKEQQGEIRKHPPVINAKK